MNKLEMRYNWIADILIWEPGKYTEEQLNKLNMPELAEIHSKVYQQDLSLKGVLEENHV